MAVLGHCFRSHLEIPPNEQDLPAIIIPGAGPRLSKDEALLNHYLEATSFPHPSAGVGHIGVSVRHIIKAEAHRDVQGSLLL